ncbi:MAG: hypothetical protein AAF696_28275, partial [Bacteroidota bacterium]
ILFKRLEKILDAKKTETGDRQEVHEPEEEWQSVRLQDFKDEFLKELESRAKKAKSRSGLDEDQMQQKLSKILERYS